MPIVLQKVSYNGYSNSNNSHPWYSHYNAFDGSEESFWESGSPCSYTNSSYLSYGWSLESFKVTRYSLYLDSVRRPIDWQFQGSTDGLIWDDLDLQVGQTGDRFEWKTYDISNDNYYSKYRIVCLAGASYNYPSRIYEVQLWADVESITTSTTTGTTNSSSTSITVTPVPSTTASSTSTATTTGMTSTTITGPSLTISTTTPPDPERLWPAEEELSIVRSNFNQWYRDGIPLGVKRVESIPEWISAYTGSMIYSLADSKYYFANNTGWVELNLGSLTHAESHASGGVDELIHIGPDTPENNFIGKLWFHTANTLTTTTLTTSTTSTTVTPLPTLTTVTQTTLPTTTITYTTTTTVSSTSSTASTTIYQNPYNVATNGTAVGDSWEIGYEPIKAFDGIDITRWLTNNFQDRFPHWIKYTLPQAEIVHTYAFIWDMDRYATTWYLEGSNNSYIWETLDFRFALEPVIGINYYYIPNRAPYKYYRFRFISGSDTRRSSLGVYFIGLYAGGLTTTSTTTTSTTTTLSTTLTSTTLTTESSSTQLVYGFVSSGGIALANDEYLGYPASNAFDVNNTTFWICDVLSGPPYWLMYYWTNKSYIVNKYVLHITTPGRPKSWKFQGSNNGTVWVDLDIQENIYDEGDLEFLFNNSTFYSYYRLYITDTHSSGYAVRVGNLELYGYRSELSTSTTTTETTTTTTLTTTTTTVTTSTASTTVYVSLEQKLLMNFNGIDGSVQSSDDTGKHTSLAWMGDAQIKTEKSVYGSSSLYIPSSSYYPDEDTLESYISIPASSDWKLGAGRGNFSVDFWLYIEKYQYLWKNWNTIVSCIESADDYWALRYYPEGNLINFSVRNNKNLIINYTSIVPWSYGQWNHLALTRIGNTFKFYHNGVHLDDGHIFDVEIPLFDGSLFIGKGPSEYLNTLLDYNQGMFWLDSLQIYQGTVITGDFQVPNQPTTSTTSSTSSTSTTTSYIRSYTPKLSLPCNDGGFDAYDVSGRHGIATLPENMTYTPQFRVSSGKVLDPLFGTTFLSAHKYPLDLTNSTDGYLTFNNHSDWRLSGANNFTVECWLAYKLTQNLYESPILSYYQDAANFWFINISCDQRKFFFKLVEAGSVTINYSTSINLQTLSWNYFAFIRKDKRFKLFWNGSQSSDWSNVFNVTIPSLSGSLYVLGGPSASNFNQIISSGIACNGIRICEGIVDGVEDGAIPSLSF